MAVLLLENGCRLLLESGGAVLLEVESASEAGVGQVFLQQRGVAVISIFDGQTIFTRGNVIPIVARFLDTLNPGAIPSSASATFRYAVSGVATSASVSLTKSGEAWIGQWDSSVADAGSVAVTVSCGGSFTSVTDGVITLTAGAANTV